MKYALVCSVYMSMCSSYIFNLKRACTKTRFLVIHPLKLTYSNKCLVGIPLSTVFSRLSLKQTLLNRSQSF